MKPQNRIGLKDIEAIKNHKYFDGVDFESIRNQMIARPPLQMTNSLNDPTQNVLVTIPSVGDLNPGINLNDNLLPNVELYEHDKSLVNADK